MLNNTNNNNIDVNKPARQTITTKYLGPTNSRGSRIKACCEAGSVVTPWDDASTAAENHAAAAQLLVQKLGWSSSDYKWHGGWNKDSTCTFVQVSLS